MKWNSAKAVKCVSVLELAEFGSSEYRIQAWESSTNSWQNVMIVKDHVAGQRINTPLVYSPTTSPPQTQEPTKSEPTTSQPTVTSGAPTKEKPPTKVPTKAPHSAGVPTKSPTKPPHSGCKDGGTYFFKSTRGNKEEFFAECTALPGKQNRNRICIFTESGTKDGVIYRPAKDVCRLTCKTCDASSPPTAATTRTPIVAPTARPTATLTARPTTTVTAGPTSSPTRQNTEDPTTAPTDTEPTKVPTAAPNSGCSDGGTYFYKVINNNRPVFKECSWLQGESASFQNRHCTTNESREKDGTMYGPAKDVCRRTCNTCVTLLPTSKAAPTSSPTAVPTAAPTSSPTGPVTDSPTVSPASCKKLKKDTCKKQPNCIFGPSKKKICFAKKVKFEFDCSVITVRATCKENPLCGYDTEVRECHHICRLDHDKKACKLAKIKSTGVKPCKYAKKANPCKKCRSTIDCPAE